MIEKKSMHQIRIKQIDPLFSGELSDKIFRKCHFCEKTCEVFGNQYKTINNLSGPGNFYCSFCLRHGLNSKGNRNFLILSFRSIIGYFYFKNYIQQNGKRMWLSEIEDFIESHRQAGLVNPLFLYDSETMLWFVDFSRVGNSKKKISVEEIIKTIVSILASFNLSETVPGIDMSSLFLKYKDAVETFYHKRFRPSDRKMLIPTFSNTGSFESKSCNLDKLRNFILDDLRIKFK